MLKGPAGLQLGYNPRKAEIIYKHEILSDF